MRRTIRIEVSALVLAASTGLVGCAPIMSHGPRVREGAQLGVTVAALTSTGRESRTALVPYFTDGTRHDDGTAEQITAQIVVPTQDWPDDNRLAGVQMDYYRERPSADSAVAHGWGIQGTPYQLMPYIQWGIYRGQGAFYTTQGIGSMGNYFGVQSEVLFWSPGFGAEYRADPVTLRVQLSTLVMYRTEDLERLNEAPITIGVSVAFGAGGAAAPTAD